MEDCWKCTIVILISRLTCTVYTSCFGFGGEHISRTINQGVNMRVLYWSALWNPVVPLNIQMSKKVSRKVHVHTLKNHVLFRKKIIKLIVYRKYITLEHIFFVSNLFYSFSIPVYFLLPCVINHLKTNYFALPEIFSVLMHHTNVSSFFCLTLFTFLCLFCSTHVYII